MVRADQIPPVVPSAAERVDGGSPGVGALHRSRLLTPAPTTDAAAIKAALTEQARAIGFGTIGITDPDAIEGARERLQTFLDAGSHGDMEWLANEPARRRQPQGAVERRTLGDHARNELRPG